MRLKRAIAVAPQDAKGTLNRHIWQLRSKNINDQVELAVPVEIAHHHSFGTRGGRSIIDVRSKRAITFAQQNGNRSVRTVKDSQVELAIPVEIAYAHHEWTCAGSIVNV